MWGVNVFEIPSISHLATLELMSELGHDFTRKFPSSKQFCCWYNIAPNTKISRGKRISIHVSHRQNNVGLIFRSIASSLANAKSQQRNFYRRVCSRARGKAAVIATAHKSLRYSLSWLQTKHLIIRKSRYRRKSITRKADYKIQA